MAKVARVSGPDLKNPQIHTSNFLIEAYFKTAPAQQDATLIQKMDDAGYALSVNKSGGVTLTAQASGGAKSLDSVGIVNDGQWHHVIVEADRKAETFTIYIDGKPGRRGPGLGADALAGQRRRSLRGRHTAGSQPQRGDRVPAASPAARWPTRRQQSRNSTRGSSTDRSLYDFTGRRRPADGGAAGAIDDVAME